MAGEKLLKILEQGHDAWNKFRVENRSLHIDLSETNLNQFNLNRMNLRYANLQQANLTQANLKHADLKYADLKGANLTNATLEKSNLSHADFRLANLTAANLSGADLTRSDFRTAHLFGAKLNGANLWGVYLGKAELSNVNFRDANLTRAGLRSTNLTRAFFGGANLSITYLEGANLTKAILSSTTFASNNLSETLGLETVEHYGPSFISIDTIRMSKGKIPTDFLRGCGLSDLEIEFAKFASKGLDQEEVTTITYELHRLYCDQPIQFYSCFISYGSKDHDFALRLHDDLQENGVRCWFAPEDMKIGDPIRPAIDRQIHLRDKLLVILSEDSIKSEWVGDEVEAAIEEEKESSRLVLLPIKLDDAVLNTREDWAAKIKRRRHIGDFSNWKVEGAYRKAFEKLLRDLKATGNQ